MDLQRTTRSLARRSQRTVLAFTRVPIPPLYHCLSRTYGCHSVAISDNWATHVTLVLLFRHLHVNRVTSSEMAKTLKAEKQTISANGTLTATRMWNQALQLQALLSVIQIGHVMCMLRGGEVTYAFLGPWAYLVALIEDRATERHLP
jgi:hypothetical protein